jgi:hypothetical protein
MCINAEELYEETLSLSLSPRKSKNDIEIVVDEIKNL